MTFRSGVAAGDEMLHELKTLCTASSFFVLLFFTGARLASGDTMVAAVLIGVEDVILAFFVVTVAVT